MVEAAANFHTTLTRIHFKVIRIWWKNPCFIYIKRNRESHNGVREAMRSAKVLSFLYIANNIYITTTRRRDDDEDEQREGSRDDDPKQTVVTKMVDRPVKNENKEKKT